ncbi:hypothetical protein LB542_13660 [Mesorhizobium sp. BR1-1-9]|uniref:hypothetical protein n=1 Tax=Mesorhizobium sp. BR1-1-9 TaxID=2876646 RepID=UPI001CD187F7|nr:hypothetical protein [Mesorhizobium sp. BR1-1-9]MBZ9871900.1 hypothetical protein [Mesorhizobium sp. BR1-1-9]
MATIPLQLATRRLDTGTVVSYPDSAPVGRAMQGLGDELSAVAERYQQVKEQQEAFDADLLRRRFDGQIAQAEDEVTANAPADGNGLHEAMYGLVDPRTGRVVKSGLFDMLFDEALPNMPESQRADFARQKEAMRLDGAWRMARRQRQRRDDYELAGWTKVDAMSTSAIAQSDPNDTANFEAIRQSGFDLIAKIGNPLIRQAAEAAWRSNTAKALVQAMIAKDPQRAAEMLGGAQAGSQTKEDSAEAVGGSNASGSSNVAAGNGTGKLTLVDVRAQVLARSSSTTPDDKTTIPLDVITYLKPSDLAALRNQANTATGAQLVNARAKVQLAEQNAPAVIASTGQYPEERPTEQDFVDIYGAEEGAKHFKTFNITAGVAGAVFDIRRAPNRAIHAELRDFEPAPNGSPEEREQYEIEAGAAQLVLGARRADPVGYVSQMFPGQAPDWSKIATPEEFQTAITWVVAAQQEMGFDRILPLPWASADQRAAKYIDQGVPFEERLAELSSIVLAVRDPDARRAMAEQISLAAEAQWRARAAQDPNMTPELLEAQLTALKDGLAWIGKHPAQAQYSTMSSLQQFGLAFGDIGRIMAKGATAGGADALVAKLAPSESGGGYEERLKEEQAQTADAEDRAGMAGWVAEGLGAGLSGYGAAKGLFSLLGRVGIGVAAEGGGLAGLGTRTAVGSVAGGAYGGVYAYNTGGSVPGGTASGALWGAGANVLAEGLNAIASQVTARLARHPNVANSKIISDDISLPISVWGAKEILSTPTAEGIIKRPYSNLKDPPTVGAGKNFTRSQKAKIAEQNRRVNGGVLRDDEDGQELVPAKKSKRGVTPPSNEAQYDHIEPRVPADPNKSPGSNSYSNAKLVARIRNRKKSNK